MYVRSGPSWYSAHLAVAALLGVLVCLAVAAVAPKFLQARGLTRLIPWVVLGSLLVTMAVAEVALLRHAPAPLPHAPAGR